MHVSLEFNGTILVQAISFLVFVFLMERFFFRPVTAAIEKRQAYVADCQLAAKRMSEESQRLRDAHLAFTKEAAQKAQVVITRAVSDAEGDRRDALSQASAEARAMLDSARREIAEEKERARLSLSKDIEGLRDMIEKRVLEKK
ncbi:MAG TPA: ATP synthase F0 subunit B [Cyanobacteria bacterium UBA8530]|nr:ATP synthase F0 subunit B [Cyanobacteria bacterium UBA8530]